MHRLILAFLIFASTSLAHLSSFAATYELSFRGTWSQNDVEPNRYPRSAHFSPIIGVTHTQGTEFWSNGSAASMGVEQVAELGITGTLTTEIANLRSAGEAGETITLDSQFNLPQTGSTRIQVDNDKAFLSLITMIAPSPDWFVGVSALPLQQNGQWRSNITVELRPYDAGTEEGNDFSLANQATSNGLITRLNGGADSPFIGRPAIATLELRLIEPVTPVEPPAEPPISTNKAKGIGSVISILLNE